MLLLAPFFLQAAGVPVETSTQPTSVALKLVGDTGLDQSLWFSLK
jgi:hypothetical protein